MPEGFKKGNVILSFPKLNTIAVLDTSTEQIAWLISNMFRYQHSARLLSNGNLLLFDNFGHHTYSRVIEFDPGSQKIHWGFYGTEKNGFRSRCCGVSQRLFNGNTLITDTTGGRAFELTEDKKVVWEYVNPHRSGPNDDYVASLFQVQRIPRAYFSDWVYGDSVNGK